MKSIIQYVPFQLSVVLILGIFIGNSTEFNPVWVLSGILIIGVVSLLLLNAKQKKFKQIFQFLIYLLFLLIGILRIESQKPQFQPTHYQHFSNKNSLAQIQIREELKDSKLYHKYIGEVIAVDSLTCKGKILLSLKKDSLQKTVQLGTILLVDFHPQKIQHPQNPHEFDFARYMKYKGVSHQLHLSKNEYKISTVTKPNLLVSIWKIRQKIQQKLSQYPFGKEEYGVLNALILGDKKFITRDLQGNYATAGVVHILAVSGLHVGIFFWILTLLFKPLERVKNGKLIVGFAIVSLLWMYAVITGLSGSVVRAVAMFSFISVGMLWAEEKRPVEEAVFASMLLLLLIHPSYLFDVGFQLSYTAVLGIIYFQPVFQKMIPKIPNTLLLYFWQITTVSMAATLATAPLTLYYFHQFPGLFLLSNLVIIPFVKIILILGILTIILALCNILPDFLVTIYNQILHGMNQFVLWVAEKESFLIQNIPFSLLDVLVTFLMLFFLYQWINEPQKIQKLKWFLGSLILFQGVFVFKKFEVTQQEQFWVFHRYKQSVLAHQLQNKLTVFSFQNTEPDYAKVSLKNYVTAERIDTVTTREIDFNYFTYRHKSILIVDSLGVYKELSFKPDVVLLTYSPKINLERLIDRLQPQKIIADGSNYPYLIKHWEKTCQQKNIFFHYTGKEGAYLFP